MPILVRNIYYRTNVFFQLFSEIFEDRLKIDSFAEDNETDVFV